MRPFIDLSNLDYDGDTLIYYSRMYVLIAIVVLFALVIGSIYVLNFENGFIFSIILWFIVLFYGQKIFYRLQRINEIQFKINAKGIQFRNEDFITWDNIENAKVLCIRKQKSRLYYFRYYIISEDRVIKAYLDHLNIGSNDLELAIRIFTEKFNIEKNKV
jgi:hypothetical protein